MVTHRIFSILKHVHPSERVASSAQVLREVTWVSCIFGSKVLPLFSCKPLCTGCFSISLENKPN